MHGLPVGYFYQVDPRGRTELVNAGQASKPDHEYFTTKGEARSAAAFKLKWHVFQKHWLTNDESTAQPSMNGSPR